MKDPELTRIEEPPAEAVDPDAIIIKVTLKPVAQDADGRTEYDVKAESDQLADADDDIWLHILETLIINIKIKKLME